MFSDIKRRWFPKGVRRSWSNLRNRLAQRVPARLLVRDLKALGLGQGDLVCVHSSLSGMGHIVGGAASVLEALRAVVGDAGTLMMPTFTGGNNTHAYVTSGPPPFDPERTQAATGRLCDTFRQQKGVERSFHPTHSVAAQGPLARELVAGHENSITPFGDGTPYDHLTRRKGKVLLLNTNGNSLLHRTQEMVDWPNHYLEELFTLEVFDRGATRTVRTAIHRPGPYSHVVLPGVEEDEVRLIHFPSYGLPFLLTGKSVEDYQRLRPDAAAFLRERYRWFQEEGIVCVRRVGFGQAALLLAADFSCRIRQDLEGHLTRNRRLYERPRLEKMWATGRANGPPPVL